MRKLGIFFGLVVVFFMLSLAAAQAELPPPACCDWTTDKGCDGGCNDSDLVCSQIGLDHSSGDGICDCIPVEDCQWVGSTPVSVTGEPQCAGLCNENYSCELEYITIENSSYCVCQVEPFCGDGVVNGVEECDDGNDVAGDGCTNCVLDPIVGQCVWNFSVRSCQGACGGPLYPCTQVGYDYQKDEGICECRPVDSCRWNEEYNPVIPGAAVLGSELNGEKCIGSCEGNLICELFGAVGAIEYCECVGIPPVPEFASPVITLLVLLCSPVFAYFLIRKRP